MRRGRRKCMGKAWMVMTWSFIHRFLKLPEQGKYMMREQMSGEAKSMLLCAAALKSSSAPVM